MGEIQIAKNYLSGLTAILDQVAVRQCGRIMPLSHPRLDSEDIVAVAVHLASQRTVLKWHAFRDTVVDRSALHSLWSVSRSLA